MEGIEQPAAPRAEGGAEAAPGAETAPAQTAADWRQSFDWKFAANGQEVTPDTADKAKTWLSLGYNASQTLAEVKRERAQWAKEREELQSKYKGYDRFAELDQYARQNPDWWKHVQGQWEQRSAYGQDPNLAPILQRLQQTEGVLQEWQQREAERKQAEQDQALEAEIESIRKQYPKIDLGSVDESGRSLEWRVLKHANDNGIQTFRAAFRDYLHDRLVQEAQAQGREAIAKDTQAKVKQGVLGTTQVPTKGLSQAQNVRGKSYDQLTQEALAEFGITSH